MNLERYVAYPYRRVAIEAAIGAVIAKTGARFLRKRLSPSLEELAAVTPTVHVDPVGLLTTGLWSGRSAGEDLADLRSEHEQLQAELASRYRTRQLPFPTAWAVETGTSFLLYALVRRLRPRIVIEMGVGNGHSSYYILRALQANGDGRLYSFDIVKEAGTLLSDDERRLWEFRLVHRQREARSLEAHLADLPRADLCFHDAGHGYLAQYLEFARLYEHLAEGGTLVLDDVDASYGLIDFCRLSGKQPEILLDGRKAVGVISRGPGQALRAAGAS